jgi:hypothetical protein
MKICSKCKIEKDESCFSKQKGTKDGLKSWCKNCIKLLSAKYIADNKTSLNEKNRQNYLNNSDYYVQYRKDNAEYIKEYLEEYRVLNKEEIKEYKRNYENSKYDADASYKLRKLVSNAVYTALQKLGGSKDNRSCLDFLGHSIQELEEHIEKQFLEPGNEWMCWDNQGAYNPKTWDDNDPSTWTWQLDHIIPQSKFQFVSMEDEEFRKCWSLNNLRPYSAKQNVIEKNNR